MTEKMKKTLTITGIIAVTVFITLYLMPRMEVTKRAKREFLEGEKFLDFYKNPDKKKIYYDEQLKNGEITEIQYRMLLEDNALKNAYVQYETVIDLFTPPESKWVKKSRQRLSEIKPEYDAWVNKLKEDINRAGNTPKTE